MIKINLLPKEVQDKGKGVEYVILGGALLAMTVISLLVLHLSKMKTYNNYLKLETEFKMELEKKKKEVEDVTKLEAEKAVLQSKENSIIQLARGKLLYPQFMESFFDILPKDIWVTGISLKEGPSKELTVVANSNSLTVDAIAELLQKLDATADRYSGVSLSAIEQRANSYAFVMTFTYRQPAKGT